MYPCRSRSAYGWTALLSRPRQQHQPARFGPNSVPALPPAHRFGVECSFAVSVRRSLEAGRPPHSLLVSLVTTAGQHHLRDLPGRFPRPVRHLEQERGLPLEHHLGRWCQNLPSGLCRPMETTHYRLRRRMSCSHLRLHRQWHPRNCYHRGRVAPSCARSSTNPRVYRFRRFRTMKSGSHDGEQSLLTPGTWLLTLWLLTLSVAIRSEAPTESGELHR